MLAGGLGLAGLAEGAARWGEFGAEIGKTARIADVASDKLQELRGAARRSDVEPGILDGTLKSLGATMQDVFYNRAAPEAISALNAMNVHFERTASGAPDVAKGFLDIADAVKHLDGKTQAQRHFLQLMGIGEEMLPMLDKGSQGIKAKMAEFRSTGGLISDEDIHKAEDFKNSLINLGDAASGVYTKLMASAGAVTEFNNAVARSVGGAGKNPFLEILEESTDLGIGKKRSLSEDINLFRSWFGKAPLSSDIPAGLSPSLSTSSAAGGVPFGGIQLGDPVIPQVNASSLIPPPPSKMAIELTIKNAPAGMQVRATTDGGKPVNARIERSLPTD